MKPGTDDFYKNLRERMRNWLSKRGKQYRYADLLLFAPDHRRRVELQVEVPNPLI